MARINVEESILKDIRFYELVIKLGEKDRALGMMVRAWILAQTFYVKSENQLIPIEEWAKSRLSPAIIECGLASLDETGRWVKVAGSDKQFAWLKQRVNAGRIGGINKSKRPLATDKRPPRAAKPLYSFLSSQKKEKEYIAQTVANAPVVSETEIASRIYAKYPRKQGKQAGVKKLLSEKPSIELVETALENFIRRMAEEKREKKFLPYFSTWVSEWQEWLDPNHGAAVGFDRNQEIEIKL